MRRHRQATVAGRKQPCRPHPAPLGGDQGRRCGHAARDPRPDPDRRLLLLAGQQLPHRRQLHQPDGADGGCHDDRDRGRLRAPPRGDRPLDRLRLRHRRGRRRKAAVPRRKLRDVRDRRDHRRDHRHGADRALPGQLRRPDRRPVVRRNACRAALLAGRDPLLDRRHGRDHDRQRAREQRLQLLLLGHRRLHHRPDCDPVIRLLDAFRGHQQEAPRHPDGQPRSRDAQARSASS